VQQLEGEALLPLDVWQAWPNTNFAALLNDSTVAKIHLTATDLDLHAASQLTGWNFPVEGIARGEVNIDGALGALVSSGRVSLSKARIPLGWTGVLLTDVESEGVLEGQKLAVTKFTARHPGGDLQAGGEVDFRTFREPALKLTLTSAKSDLTFFPGASAVSAAAQLALVITGPGRSAVVSGDARLISLGAAPLPDLAPTLFGAAELPAPLAFPPGLWNAWPVDVAVKSTQSLPFGSATVSADLRVTGTVAEPALLGAARLAGQPARIGQTAVVIDEAALEFRAGAPRDPSLALQATGSLFGESFAVLTAGPLSRLMHFFKCDPPLTSELLNAQLADAGGPFQPEIALLIPAAQASGAEVFEWVPIAIASEQ
jgi:hypothetical protein